MSIEKMYGAPDLEAERWRRVVRALDEHVSNWRGTEPRWLGDVAVAAIARLAKKPVPKPEPVPAAPSVRTEDDYKPSDLTHDCLARLTLALVDKHGRQAAVDALNKFDAGSVSYLRVKDLRSYFEFARAELHKPVADDAPTQGEWDKHARYFKNSHRMIRTQLTRIETGNIPSWAKR